MRHQILRRHIQHYRTKVYPHHLLNRRNDQHESRSFGFPETPQHKYDTALIFAQDAESGDENQRDQEDDAGGREP